MAQVHEILMAGTGGQGLILMATFLAEAAIEDGLHVAQTQSYGVAQRGGFISAEVIISNQKVLYQNTRVPNIILALHGVVGARYDESPVPVLFDSSLFEKKLPNWYPIPFTQIAKALGSEKSANIIALGAMVHFVPAVSLDSLKKVASKRFKGRIAECNIQGIEQGYAAAKALTPTK